MNILITGAARGIGLELVKQYHELNNNVIGTYRGKAPSKGNWLKLDVTDKGSLDHLVDTLAVTSIDTLICNAGVFLDRGQTLEAGIDLELWERSFAVNTFGVFHTIQRLIPNLKLSKNPKIAIIASKMGSSNNSGGSSYVYRSSKAAVINIGSNLAIDLKPKGISVGIYHPGWVQTDMGGMSADITSEQSSAGLIQQIEKLNLDTTGEFKTWDGESIPF